MITRRSLLWWAGASGLVVTVSCKSKKKASEPPIASEPDVTTSASGWQPPAASGAEGELSAWIHIAENDVVTFYVPEAEMGQGVHTAVAMILAAELGCQWRHVVARHAPVRAEFGRQSTGGSSSIRGGFETIRRAAATARELLIAAASEQLGIPGKECAAEESVVRWTKGNKRARFGELAVAAAELEVPADIPLRDKLDLGVATPRLDSFEKVTGRAVYGIDSRVDGMLIGKVLHAPSYGGVVVSVDDGAAREVEGVRDVVQIDSGVCVLADHTWAAHKGREALNVKWNEPNERLNSAGIESQLRGALARGKTLFERGAVEKAAAGHTVVEGEYDVPYLAHAPMEPLSCTVKLDGDGCEIWTSTQSPTNVANAAAEITGLAPDKIAVHSQYLGGGFGRRSQTDYVEEAVEAAKKSGKIVKLVWDREDDIRGYQYRPVALNALRGAVDPGAGKLALLEHRIASPSILKRFGPLVGGIDGTAVDGVVKYCPEAMRVTYADVDTPCSTWFWRSVGHSQNGFVTEGFMSELAHAAGRDQIDFRLETPIMRLGEDGALEENERLRKVLEIVADKAWSKKPAEGIGRGVAISESFGSFTAQVVEASIEKGRPRVHRVVCVVDCGEVINPLTVEAQVESGIVYGLSAALYGKIEFAKGRVVQGNFDKYQVLRMREMPAIETHIVPSKEAHGGVGEPSTGPIAGALVGALFALDKKPRRRLPLVAEA